jgi:hypothetical protein
MNIAPTPWKTGRTISRAVYAADETPICICDSMGEATAAQEANHARLIAAAPDLLAALQNLIAAIEASDAGWLGIDAFPEDFERVLATATQ